ncbi:MAG: hypothetical protein J7M08_07925, partial [Planctomycetes bacterium]|nr:hypothetical protein [Planctomycetota bacterium]
YYQEIGRAGRDGKQAHCALIVRPPHEKCIEGYLGRSKSKGSVPGDERPLPPCLRGKYRTNRKCPPEIGLPAPCDLAKQLHMVLTTYIKAETFCKKCADTWKQLNEERNEQDEASLYVSGRGTWAEWTQQNKHNHLWRLHQLGLVAKFTLEYVSRGHYFDVVFHTSLSPNPSVEGVRKQLVKELAQIALTEDEHPTHEKMTERRQHLMERVQGSLAGDGPLTNAAVREAVRILFGAVRRKVLNMRFASFAKLQDYIGTPDPKCRRAALLEGMTESEVFGADYHCGFCDHCVEGLNFDQSSATPGEDSAQYEDIFHIQRDSFRSGNVIKMENALTEALGRKVGDAFGRRASTHLEYDPDNLVANLAAAEAFAKSDDTNLRTYAHMYHKQFAQIANVERQDSDLAEVGYRRYRDFDAPESIRTFAISGAAMDNARDLVEMAHDGESAGLDTSESDNLDLAAFGALQHKLAEASDRTMEALSSLLA